MNKNQYNLGLAAASGDIYLVKECIENGCTDFDKPYNGMTPLCLAAFWNNNDIVEFLLEKGYYLF
jgi:ankyrin repeat protein